MIVISSTQNGISEISPKLISKLRAEKLIETIIKNKPKMIKTASSGDGMAVATALAKALSEMHVKAEVDLSELFKKILNASMEKTAENKNSSREESIKIASKEIKDSHYQIDVSKDLIEKNGSKLIMISAYARDAYLGRYLTKRNYYYLLVNDKQADDSFEEICGKMRRIKQNYYDGKTTVKSIVSDVMNVLKGVVCDMKFEEEDDIGTTVKR